MTVILSFPSYKIALDASTHMRVRRVMFQWGIHKDKGMFIVRIDNDRELPPLLEQYKIDTNDERIAL